MATADKKPSIIYSVDLFDAKRHLLLVSLCITAAKDALLPAALKVSLPAWIPGSYMIRDFAKNITQISAVAGIKKIIPLKLHKLDKQTWQIEEPKTIHKSITFSLLVYAWDLSVRSAHFDESHCFFNGTSVFLKLDGFEHLPHRLSVTSTDGTLLGWKVASSLRLEGGRASDSSVRNLKELSSRFFVAENYDDLIDHPFEIGNFQHAQFKAHGTTHHIAITGAATTDLTRLKTDFKKICEAQIAFFEPTSKKAPFPHYWFMVMAVGDGYGGLEHRASTALICSRNELPFVGMPSLNNDTPHEGYKNFLGLVSHEYFHSWNVKRIKPAQFSPYDLDNENYTRLLWIFEGFTSYYDDLFLVRTGIVSKPSYFNTLAQTLTGVAKTPGRLRQSVAESSFDAWTKYYKQDENSVNAIISYYTKGSLVALALDLAIRARSPTKTLDDVMRLLWENTKRGQALDEDAFSQVVEAATGVDLFVEIAEWAYGTQDIAWDALLQPLGMELTWRNAGLDRVWLGGKLGTPNAAGISVANVLGHGPLAKAGVSAGDMIVAMNHLKADDLNLRGLLQRSNPGDKVTLHVFRRDELRSFELALETPPKLDAQLKEVTKPTKLQQNQLNRWIGN